jgi:DNA processing protein
MGTDRTDVTLSDTERLDWLRLIRSENVGPRTFSRLMTYYGSAAGALAALPDLARRGGASEPARICSRAEAEREVKAAQAIGIRLVAICESDYPERLAMIEDAPPVLAVRGKMPVLARPMVAIVGSRNASAAGIKLAERLGHDIGEAGFVIASGLARGIDAAAHRASIKTGTVAALAGGHDCIYPPENFPLADAIAADGALISEMPVGWSPRARDFPRRNRLISGLAVAVVVIEAAQRSGSLITARMALEQGREVFAAPGSPLDPRCEGTNRLLKQGATLVTEAADVVAVVRPILGQEILGQEHDRPAPEPSRPAAQAPEPNGSERTRVLTLLGPTPIGIDDLVRMAESTPAAVRSVLLELEVAGRLRWHRGAQVALIPSD